MICLVVACQRERLSDAQVCRGHLWALWLNLLDRLDDGSFAAPQADGPRARS
jgi:hypothetical protein